MISSVILLDQIPRHYKRLGYEIDVYEYSEKAAKLSDYILSIYNTSILTYDELCLVYLPYRHLKRIEKIYEIINIFINLYNKAHDINKAKCKRYLYATLNNIYKDINRKSLNYYLQPKSWNALNKDIFDKQSLDTCNTEYNIQENILYNTIYQEYIKSLNGATGGFRNMANYIPLLPDPYMAIVNGFVFIKIGWCFFFKLFFF